VDHGPALRRGDPRRLTYKQIPRRRYTRKIRRCCSIHRCPASELLSPRRCRFGRRIAKSTTPQSRGYRSTYRSRIRLVAWTGLPVSRCDWWLPSSQPLEDHKIARLTNSRTRRPEILVKTAKSAVSNEASYTPILVSSERIWFVANYVLSTFSNTTSPSALSTQTETKEGDLARSKFVFTVAVGGPQLEWGTEAATVENCRRYRYWTSTVSEASDAPCIRSTNLSQGHSSTVSAHCKGRPRTPRRTPELVGAQ